MPSWYVAFRLVAHHVGHNIEIRQLGDYDYNRRRNHHQHCHHHHHHHHHIDNHDHDDDDDDDAAAAADDDDDDDDVGNHHHHRRHQRGASLSCYYLAHVAHCLPWVRPLHSTDKQATIAANPVVWMVVGSTNKNS